jgi:glycosyltransferase involved in cell wall biosynthesis
MIRKTVLIICDGLPYPPNDGVRTRVYNISKQLLKEFDLRIICIIKNESELILLDDAQRMLENSIFPVKIKYDFWKKLYAIMVNIFQTKPLEYHFYYFHEVATSIQKLLQNQNINFIQFERSFLSFYSSCIPKNIPIIINLYDYESLRYKRLFELAPAWTKFFNFYNWKRVQNFETKSLLNSNHIFTISNNEKNAILQNTDIAGSKLSVLTGGIDLELYQFVEKLPAEKNIIFVGSGMSFNYDAIKFFYFQIFPNVKKVISDVNWYIVGKLDQNRLKYLLDDPSVHFFSNVQSVIPYYKKCRLLIVPLRGGGGTRIKIIEAMAVGRPIVSTSVGCEGINVTNNDNIIIANSISEFASAVCELLADDEKCNILRINAYEFVSKNFGWVQACKPLLDFYRKN